MFSQLLRHSDNIAKSRSSAITPLMWLLGTVGAIAIAIVLGHADFWVQVTFVILVVVAFVAVIAAYWYFAKKDPAALRSEHFALINKALNMDLQGDNLSNLGKVIDILDPKVTDSGDNPKKLGSGQ